MSVALLITMQDDPEARRLVPVATQQIFRDHWMRGCRDLGLRWVPQFETGIPLSKDDIPEVLEDLRVLRLWAKGANVPGWIQSRMDNLARELMSLDWSLPIDVSVG
jgi:hypothetical protein